jgi:TolB-like protein/DNA-binding winged helix-turn-helix (wHTH) protein/Flp pilus assembly protein TadD
MAVGAQHRIASFGDFIADLRANELRRNGIRLKLPGQPFAVLAMLLERPGEVVTREELRGRLWKEETFVDFNHSLNVAINRIREVLCDSAERPRYVETVPRVGYRFIASVSADTPPVAVDATAAVITIPGETPQKAEPAPVQAPPSPKPDKRWVRMRWYLAAITLVVVSAVVPYMGFRSSRWASPEQKIMLAVLPFENLTGDPANEYFSDGLTEEMITQLAGLQPNRLGVIARTSVMSYKHSDRNIARVGRQLGVQYILEGSLRESTVPGGAKAPLSKSGSVRITAQLVQVKDQTQIWAQDYDRDLGDVLTLESEVSGNVAREIQLQLTSQQQDRLTHPRPVDAEAHELYLRGRFYWNQRDAASFAKAIECFRLAIVKDPNYAAAYSGLADTYALSGGANLIPESEAIPRAKAAAEKALAIDADLAEAHASLGLIAPFLDWNWNEAQRHYERAIELNPNYATGHHWYAEGYLMPMGRVDDAIAEIRKARQLDPLSAVITVDLGKELFFARRYDEALNELRRGLELDPNFISARNWISDTLLEKGMYLEATAELEKTKTFREESVYVRQTAYLHARMGHQTEARAELAKALRLSQGKPISSGAVALTYAALDDKDSAFLWLEKAYEGKSSFLTTLKFWTVFDPLRQDPRFVELERRVKLLP